MKLRKPVQIALVIFIIAIIIFGIEAYHQRQAVGKIFINIKASKEQQNILDTTEIKRLLTDNGKEVLTGMFFNKVSIKTLEARLKNNLFVDKCEIARNLKGDLFVEVAPARPIARFMREGKPDFYVDSTGKVMPVSLKNQVRVVLVTRKDTQEIDFVDYDKNLLFLLRAITKDEFWKAQIAQIDIDEDQDIVLYTQVGGQNVVFGKPQQIQEKLKKLRIFYQEIIPRKGWKAYKKVNLKFENQIVCE